MNDFIVKTQTTFSLHTLLLWSACEYSLFIILVFVLYSLLFLHTMTFNHCKRASPTLTIIRSFFIKHERNNAKHQMYVSSMYQEQFGSHWIYIVFIFKKLYLFKFNKSLTQVIILFSIHIKYLKKIGLSNWLK